MPIRKAVNSPSRGSAVKRATQAVEEHLDQVVKRLTLEIHSELVRRTPKDTGHARANWVPSVGAPFTGVVGSPENVTAGERAQGLIEILSESNIHRKPVYISNNVPYIRRLNYGHSQQAPARFVENAIRDATARVRGGG